jgi:hypothetical protein
MVGPADVSLLAATVVIALGANAVACGACPTRTIATAR